MTDRDEFVLKASCRAASGIIASVSQFLFDHGCYINELAQFDDHDTGRLFMRARCFIESGQHSLADLQSNFPAVAHRLQMQWLLRSMKTPVRMMILVSQFDHCLENILYRLRKGELNAEITAVVSNHLTLRPMVEREGIRFIYLPIQRENKIQQEQELLAIFQETGSELMVLARYMQILSDALCRELVGQIINIHHSFLPGFKGAKPYHQAYQRGVKLIGATAHYVTSDLDEGPIIEQAVQPVDHTYSPAALAEVGRDTETMALARAVKLHTEQRVFLDGNKTVILR